MFNCKLLTTKWKVKHMLFFFFVLSWKQTISLKKSHKGCGLSRSGQHGYATWLEWKGILFGQEVFFKYVPIIQHTFLGIGRGSIRFWKCHCFWVRYTFSKCVSVFLAKWHYYLCVHCCQFLSHCVRKPVSTRFLSGLSKHNNTSCA